MLGNSAEQVGIGIGRSGKELNDAGRATGAGVGLR
jgi:hypothetical protein